MFPVGVYFSSHLLKKIKKNGKSVFPVADTSSRSSGNFCEKLRVQVAVQDNKQDHWLHLYNQILRHLMIA